MKTKLIILLTMLAPVMFGASVVNGTFTGNSGGLTNLNGTNLVGTLTNNTAGNAATATSATAVSGSVNASQLTGTMPVSVLPSLVITNVVFTNAGASYITGQTEILNTNAATGGGTDNTKIAIQGGSGNTNTFTNGTAINISTSISTVPTNGGFVLGGSGITNFNGTWSAYSTDKYGSVLYTNIPGKAWGNYLYGEQNGTRGYTYIYPNRWVFFIYTNAIFESYYTANFTNWSVGKIGTFPSPTNVSSSISFGYVTNFTTNTFTFSQSPNVANGSVFNIWHTNAGLQQDIVCSWTPTNDALAHVGASLCAKLWGNNSSFVYKVTFFVTWTDLYGASRTNHLVNRGYVASRYGDTWGSPTFDDSEDADYKWDKITFSSGVPGDWGEVFYDPLADLPVKGGTPVTLYVETYTDSEAYTVFIDAFGHITTASQ